MACRSALASPAGWAAAALGYVAADLLTGTSLPTTLRLTAANLAGVLAGFAEYNLLEGAVLFTHTEILPAFAAAVSSS